MYEGEKLKNKNENEEKIWYALEFKYGVVRDYLANTHCYADTGSRFEVDGKLLWSWVNLHLKGKYLQSEHVTEEKEERKEI